MKNNHSKEISTYYFLDDPVALGTPLLKDGGNKKGRGKNWVAAMIPKNRCVTFQEFTRRVIFANSKQGSSIRANKQVSTNRCK